MTELDALLDRVREDKADPHGKNRNTVAYDCWRMFEDLATRFQEESAMHDRYKSRASHLLRRLLKQDTLIADLRKSLAALFPIALFSVPKRGHIGACGPESGCDAICQDVATLSEILRDARMAMDGANHASDCAFWVDEPCDCVTGKAAK